MPTRANRGEGPRGRQKSPRQRTWPLPRLRLQTQTNIDSTTVKNRVDRRNTLPRSESHTWNKTLDRKTWTQYSRTYIETFSITGLKQNWNLTTKNRLEIETDVIATNRSNDTRGTPLTDEEPTRTLAEPKPQNKTCLRSNRSNDINSRRHPIPEPKIITGQPNTVLSQVDQVDKHPWDNRKLSDVKTKQHMAKTQGWSRRNSKD